MRHPQKQLYKSITIAGVIGLLASFFQLLEKIHLLEQPTAQLICNINPVFNCTNILNTWQSSVFGFPNSLMCIIFFAVMTTAGLIGWFDGLVGKVLRNIFMGFSLFFVGFGFWYLWQSIFVVGSLCIYCLFCYGAVLVICGSWVRLNYQEWRLTKHQHKTVDGLVKSQVDIFLWLLIAIIIIAEIIIRFLR